MKLIQGMVLLLALALAMGPIDLEAAELPASIGAGMLVSKGSAPVPVGVVSAVQNLKEFKNQAGTVTKIQVYLDAAMLYIDDYYAEAVSPEVLAIDPVLTAKLFAGPINVSLGVGAQWEIVSGQDNFLPVMGCGVGWAIAPEFATLNVGVNYIPVGEHKPDYVLPSVRLGLDGPRLIEAFTGWLTK